nr:MAG TPA: Protein of unknown function (DUF2583) [Bacteriophage sp.]
MQAHAPPGAFFWLVGNRIPNRLLNVFRSVILLL